MSPAAILKSIFSAAAVTLSVIAFVTMSFMPQNAIISATATMLLMKNKM